MSIYESQQQTPLNKEGRGHHCTQRRKDVFPARPPPAEFPAGRYYKCGILDCRVFTDRACSSCKDWYCAQHARISSCAVDDCKEPPGPPCRGCTHTYCAEHFGLHIRLAKLELRDECVTADVVPPTPPASAAAVPESPRNMEIPAMSFGMAVVPFGQLSELKIDAAVEPGLKRKAEAPLEQPVAQKPKLNLPRPEAVRSVMFCPSCSESVDVFESDTAEDEQRKKTYLDDHIDRLCPFRANGPWRQQAAAAAEVKEEKEPIAEPKTFQCRHCDFLEVAQTPEEAEQKRQSFIDHRYKCPNRPKQTARKSAFVKKEEKKTVKLDCHHCGKFLPVYPSYPASTAKLLAERVDVHAHHFCEKNPDREKPEQGMQDCFALIKDGYKCICGKVFTRGAWYDKHVKKCLGLSTAAAAAAAAPIKAEPSAAAAAVKAEPEAAPGKAKVRYSMGTTAAQEEVVRHNTKFLAPYKARYTSRTRLQFNGKGMPKQPKKELYQATLKFLANPRTYKRIDPRVEVRVLPDGHRLAGQRGVFAKERIPINTPVFTYVGRIGVFEDDEMSDAQKRGLRCLFDFEYPNPEDPKDPYVFVMDAGNGQGNGVAEYVNDFRRDVRHPASDDNDLNLINLDFVQVIQEGDPNIMGWTTRDVEVGEELVCDYGEDYWLAMNELEGETESDEDASK